jgi:hypothetical protein
MVCSQCTLLHPEYAIVCSRCGQPFRTALQRFSTSAIEHASLAVGMASGAALLLCLSLAAIVPTAATQVLSIGAYFGIISITNVWLSVYRDDQDEWIGGMRGVGYSAVLLFSLVGELARLRHIQTLALPALPGLPANVPVPSPFMAELLAAVLIIADPLLVKPVIRWVAEGVEHGDPTA